MCSPWGLGLAYLAGIPLTPLRKLAALRLIGLLIPAFSLPMVLISIFKLAKLVYGKLVPPFVLAKITIFLGGGRDPNCPKVQTNAEAGGLLTLIVRIFPKDNLIFSSTIRIRKKPILLYEIK